jgi:hypothetical protein
MDPFEFLPAKPEPTFRRPVAFRSYNDRPKPNIILSHAVQRVFSQGNREYHAFWFAQQMRDNGYSKEETTQMMKDYHNAVKHWGDHPFSLSEAMGGLSAYSNKPRAPWSGRTGDATTNS